MEKNEDKSFWTIVGVFIALWGVTELNGGSIWILASEQLFPLFLVTVGITMVAKTVWGSISAGGM